MTKKQTKILFTALAVLCILSLCVSPAMAEENIANVNGERPADTEIQDGYIDLEDELGINDNIDPLPADVEASFLPEPESGNPSWESSYFNLAELGYVTPVKNQRSYGTCWAFAAMGAIESNILMQGGTALDLSEHHLAYSFYDRTGITNPSLEKFSGLNGDDMQYQVHDPDNPDDWYMQAGGSSIFTGLHMMTGIDPIPEDLAPYQTMVNLYTPDQKEAKEYTLNPEISGETDYVVTSTYYVHLTNRDLVQQYLTEKGAATIAYYSGGQYILANPETEEMYYYTSSKGDGNITTYYDGTAVSGDHEVTLVGWNETLSSYLFADVSGEISYYPENDGAWLIKNSWDDDWGDEGYFWLSYDTKSLENEVAVFYEVTPASEISNIYQYDGTASYGNIQVSSPATIENFFTTETSDVITSVAFMTLTENLGYEVTLFKDIGDNLMIPLASAEGVAPVSGYHNVELSEPVSLPPNTEFAVRVTFTLQDPSIQSIEIPFDRTDRLFGDTTLVTSAYKQEQGYLIYADGTMEDGYDIGGNFRIKAYGSPTAVDDETVDPNLSITVTKDETGTTITKTTGTIFSIDLDTVAITDARDVVMLVDFKEDVVPTTSVTGNVTNVLISYPLAAAEAGAGVSGSVSFVMELTTTDVPQDPPTMDAAYVESIKEKVTTSVADVGSVPMMITATNTEDVTGIIKPNGIQFMVMVPTSWVNEWKNKGGIWMFHVHDGVVQPLTRVADGNIKDNGDGTTSITFSGSEYSTYGLVGLNVPKKEESSTPMGSSVWLTEIPTITPTATPSATPTDVAPTFAPTQAIPTEPPKSPGFGVLGILAWLGFAAVAVLRRK